MLGPVGVSKYKDNVTPPKTAMRFITILNINMVNADLLINLALATGIINIAPMSSAPTNCTDNETKNAKTSIKINLSKNTGTPSALATSL